jgi:hypothetical protein
VSYLNEAAEKVRDVGELLVERSGVEPGMEVLDVAPAPATRRCRRPRPARA